MSVVSELQTEDIVINGKTFNCFINSGPRYAIISKPKEVVLFGKVINVYRIIALQEFADLKTGDFGGYTSISCTINEEPIGYLDIRSSATIKGCINQYGRAWIYDDAIVINSSIKGDTFIEGNSTIIYNSTIESSGVGCSRDNNQITIKECILKDSVVNCPSNLINSKLNVSDIDGDGTSIRVIQNSVLSGVESDIEKLMLDRCCLLNCKFEDKVILMSIDINGSKYGNKKLIVSGNSNTLTYDGPNIEISVNRDRLSEEEIRRQVKAVIDKREELSKIKDKAVSIKNKLS